MSNKQEFKWTLLPSTVYGSTSDLVSAFQQEENKVTPRQIFSKMGCMSLCPSTIPFLTFIRDKSLGHGAQSLPTVLLGPQEPTSTCDLQLSQEQPVNQTVPHTGRSRPNPCGLGVEGISPGFRADLRSNSGLSREEAQNPSCLLAAHRSTQKGRHYATCSWGLMPHWLHCCGWHLRP